MSENKDELSIHQSMLPDTIPDLSRFVLVGREKLTAVRAEIRAIDKVGLARDVHEQKLREAQALSEAVIDAEVRLGQLLSETPKVQGKRNDLELCHIGATKSKNESLKEAGFTRQQASNYEQLYKHPEVVEKAKKDARDNGEIVSRSAILQEIAAKRKPYIINNSGDTEWYTPEKYIESARRVLGTIDLDHCSSELANGTVKAAEYFTEKDDGLSKDWSGKVWLNPPYAKAGAFVDKLIDSPSVEEAIVLVNNATETVWFGRLAEAASAIVFHRGRLRFVKPGGEDPTPPMQGQAFVYVGEHPEAFLKEFLQYGWGTYMDSKC